MRGFIVGALALIALQVLTSHANAAGAVSGIAAGAGKAVQAFIDPYTPAIPDHSKSQATTSADTTPATSSSGAPSVGSPPGNTGIVPAGPNTI